MTGEAGLRAAVEAWIADDPDADDRAELRALLDRTDASDELRDRFAGRLRFGTAGLRGAVAAGPNRIDRAVVKATTAAVAGWLLESGVGAAGNGAAGNGAGVVVGCDARHRSADFADETGRVLAGAGIAVHLLPRPCPTPLLAFAVRHLGAAAGVMITASHNPAADNGYKLYLSDGAQVIPPADAEIEKRISSLGPLAQVPVAEAARSSATWRSPSRSRAARSPRPATPQRGGWLRCGPRSKPCWQTLDRSGRAGFRMRRAALPWRGMREMPPGRPPRERRSST